MAQKHVFWKKDDFFEIAGNRIDMDPSVVELPEKDIPLVWRYSFDVPPLGLVKDVRLEDGELTCWLEFFKADKEEAFSELLKSKDIRLGGYYDKVIKTRGARENHYDVVECKLKAVSAILAW